MGRLLQLASFLSVLLSGALCTNYHGYKVIRVTPEDSDELDTLNYYLEHTLLELDVWKEPTLPGAFSDIMVAPGDIKKLIKDLGHLKPKVHIDDVQKVLDVDKLRNEAARRMKRSYFDTYHPLEEIMDFIEEKVARCGPRCEVIQIGRSWEGRPIHVVKIGVPGENKPQIWLDAGIHAREWVAHHTGTFIIDRLIDDYETDPYVEALEDMYDFYFLPVVNPDGYVYSWEHDRLWRKSRSINASTSCVGADVNRNFDYKWMTVGASSNPCSITFAGFFPLSEPEAEAQATYVRNHPGYWETFITIHTYGQLWMAPWGYTTVLPDNYDELMVAGRVGVEALNNVYGTQFRLGSASQILYQSSGTSRDWAAGQGIPYVYTLELRDTGAYGFVLPPEQALPSARETWAGLREMFYFIMTQSPEKK